MKSASVALLQSAAEVIFDPAVTGAKRILEAVDDAGFDAAVTATLGGQNWVARRQCARLPRLAQLREPQPLRKRAVTGDTIELILSSVLIHPADAPRPTRSGSGALLSRARLRFRRAAPASSSASATSLERALRSLPGVARAAVAFPLDEVDVEFDGSACTTADLLRAAQQAGFAAEVLRAGEAGKGELQLSTVTLEARSARDRSGALPRTHWPCFAWGAQCSRA